MPVTDLESLVLRPRTLAEVLEAARRKEAEAAARAEEVRRALAAENYRCTLSILGFVCHRQTWDSAINDDGWGDEVAVHTHIAFLNRDGSLKAEKSVQTPVYGQSGVVVPGGYIAIPGRLPGGTATPWGGIQDGDGVPATRPQELTGVQPLSDRLPMRLTTWSGTTDKPFDGTVTITPTLWEWDGEADVLQRWGPKVSEWVKKHGKEIAKWIPVKGVAAAVTWITENIDQIRKWLADNVGEKGNRPIGQHRAQDGVRTFVPQAVTLDCKKLAEAATMIDPRWNDPSGVYRIRYADSGHGIGDGRYDVLIHVRYETWPKQ